MSAILKFDYQKREHLRVSEVNYLNYTKRPNFACGNNIFPETRGNKNKPWTHSTPLKSSYHLKYFQNNQILESRVYTNPFPVWKLTLPPGNRRFKIFPLKWGERMKLKVPGAILPLGCVFLSSGAKTVWRVIAIPFWKLTVNNDVLVLPKLQQ